MPNPDLPGVTPNTAPPPLPRAVVSPAVRGFETLIGAAALGIGGFMAWQAQPDMLEMGRALGLAGGILLVGYLCSFACGRALELPPALKAGVLSVVVLVGAMYQLAPYLPEMPQPLVTQAHVPGEQVVPDLLTDEDEAVLDAVMARIEAYDQAIEDAQLTRRPTTSDAWEELQSISEQQDELIERQLQGDTDAVIQQVELVGQSADILQQASDSASGDEAKLLAISAEVMGRIEITMSQYAAGMQQLTSQGGFDPVSLTSREQIARRLAALDQFEAANDAATEFFEDLPDTIDGMIEQHQVSDVAGTSFRAGFFQEQRLDLVLAVRETDRKIAQHGRAMLELLDTHWGAWEADPQTGGPRFTDEAIIQTYNEHYLELQRATLEQQRLMREAQAGL